MKRILCCFCIMLGAAASGARAADYSIDTLKLTKTDLPAGYELGNEINTISIQPVSFYNLPDQSGMLPKPTKKSCQELRFKGDTRGTLMTFQYGSAVDTDRVELFLTGFLWDGTGGPTAVHPEELYVAGNVIFIFCFGLRSDESRLVRGFLMEKKGVALEPGDDPFKKVMRRARRYYNKSDVQKGIRYLKKEYDTIRYHSVGQLFLAEFYYMARDWAGAGRHYRLALDLHEGKDPLPDPGSLWACHRGLGVSLAMTGRVKESIAPLAMSLELGRKNRRNTQVASSAYDLSCSQAVLKQFDSAYPLLAEAIRLDAKYKVMARGDDCFRDALAEKRFSDLLK
jgi:hypothetical protein